jgi:hypothetical protein
MVEDLICPPRVDCSWPPLTPAFCLCAAQSIVLAHAVVCWRRVQRVGWWSVLRPPLLRLLSECHGYKRHGLAFLIRLLRAFRLNRHGESRLNAPRGHQCIFQVSAARTPRSRGSGRGSPKLQTLRKWLRECACEVYRCRQRSFHGSSRLCFPDGLGRKQRSIEWQRGACDLRRASMLNMAMARIDWSWHRDQRCHRCRHFSCLMSADAYE